MRIPYYRIHAFSDRIDGGNPAGVCILDQWLTDTQMQQLAKENNLSETAFVVPGPLTHALRWFTPTVEIDLCGHGTLAAAVALYDALPAICPPYTFETKSGPLTVKRLEHNQWEIDLPARKPKPTSIPPQIQAAVKPPIQGAFLNRDLILIMENEMAIRELTPEMALLAQDSSFAQIFTAPGDNCDFVSRVFAPGAGVPEDPVTGSAHAELIPLWAELLGKTQLSAHQLSARGGKLICKLVTDRALMSGAAYIYQTGELHL